LREKVPYRVVQDDNILLVYFEASNIQPPVFEKARKKVVLEEEEQVVAQTEQKAEIPTAETSPKEKEEVSKEKESLSKIEVERREIEEEIFGPPKSYTGEKIKLDFYDTDIKNVFRILRSVGDVNFAIDKDVEGKVTLTLEHPVPWDQVLDLILKMNNLGMKQEGNIVRIATIDTLKGEQQEKQDLIKAKYKSREQKKALTPLVTEYLPINYSDADGDIKPHLEKVLSGRGKISVDKRTNIIILTDTPSVIEQAKEIIYSLDKVTPQIMIEAKIVEVSKDFARSLGIGWSMNNDLSLQEDGVKDAEISTNYPVSNDLNFINLAFYRMFGSDHLALGAQLSASESKGDLKIISSPKILTLDNKEAMIRQGLQYPYLERDDTGGATVKFKDIDLKLIVTPHVTFDQRISLKVQLYKDDIDSFTSGVPSLSTNTAETELLLNDKDTIVIGGIVKNSFNQGTAGLPWFSSLPGIGRLFRTDTKADTVKELLIFLTPSIIQLEQRRSTLSSVN
ncbi:MAG: type IV pilus secretin PilQ, partial [Desulfobacteraceae bacterium]|nr:type IV pilus secretin PilQ [Desulfobacteraceae bacterium]